MDSGVRELGFRNLSLIIPEGWGSGDFGGDYTVFRVNRGGIREEYKWGIEEN